MRVAGNRNRFEASLVDCAETRNAMGILPAARMRCSQPVHEAGKGAVGLWSDDEMPMVRHDAVRKKCHVDALDGFFEQVFKREIVAGVMKEQRPFRRSIQHVKNHSCGAFPVPSGHGVSPEAIGVPIVNRIGVLNK